MKKRQETVRQEPQPGWFWIAAGLLVVLLASIMVRDISRPITGLHSWAWAQGYWAARSHVKYGLGYTKGFQTYVVGDPPPKKPTRYLDNPQLQPLISAVFMAVLGFHDWTYRVEVLCYTVAALVILLLAWRRLFGPRPAVLQGLLFVLLPITGYFGTGLFSLPVTACLLNLLAYIPLSRLTPQDEDPPAWRLWALAGTLFLCICLTWLGVGWALAIGLDYLLWCLRRRQRPRGKLLVVMIASPLAAMLANYLYLTAGRGWDFGGLVRVYLWRGGFQSKSFDWGAWFARLGEFAVSDFTWPVLLMMALGLVYVGVRWAGSLGRRAGGRGAKGEKEGGKTAAEGFPLLVVFLVPGLFQLFVFRDALWYHQFWLAHSVPFVAISAAYGIIAFWTMLRRWDIRIAYGGTVLLLAVVSIACMRGLNHYFYDFLDQSPRRVRMMQMLNKEIPPDKALLSIESFMVMDNPAKGAHMRPEIAWYLDRRIIQPKLHMDPMREPATGRVYYRVKPAETLAEILKLVRAGEGRYFLVPLTRFVRVGESIVDIKDLVQYLMARYQYRIIEGDPPTPPGKRWLSKMGPQVIFDMTRPTGGSGS
ncbi:MAG: glycosyltransferase family 39 protein [Planctomycetes bacterium]|nr:glycosyltransferase family 39 protein [Planctomycetota bacterium]